MDQDDSYSVQTCTGLGHHCFAASHTHWDELSSFGSSVTQSSENINKPCLTHSQVYTPEGDPQDYPPSALRVIPPSSKSGLGKEPGMDRGSCSILQIHYNS